MKPMAKERRVLLRGLSDITERLSLSLGIRGALRISSGTYTRLLVAGGIAGFTLEITGTWTCRSYSIRAGLHEGQRCWVHF